MRSLHRRNAHRPGATKSNALFASEKAPSPVHFQPLALQRIARKYVAFVRQPGVGRLLWVAILARMPIGMVGFSMLMFLREAMGSFALD